MRGRLPTSPGGFDEQEGAAAAVVVLLALAFFAILVADKVYRQGWPW